MSLYIVVATTFLGSRNTLRAIAAIVAVVVKIYTERNANVATDIFPVPLDFADDFEATLHKTVQQVRAPVHTEHRMHIGHADRTACRFHLNDL